MLEISVVTPSYVLWVAVNVQSLILYRDFLWILIVQELELFKKVFMDTDHKVAFENSACSSCFVKRSPR